MRTRINVSVFYIYIGKVIKRRTIKLKIKQYDTRKKEVGFV